jgi:pimeloyl-ACP methyl ester carboxylesterase
MLGRRAGAPYLLRDMAADTFGLMDHLGIDSAHVAGASMGGMIVQTMAIKQPDRVRSLVSIMSNTGSRWTGMPSRKAMAVLLGRPPRGREAAVARAVKTFGVIGSPGYPFDEERLRDVAGRSYDRGHSAAGVLRQLHAITASGDRTKALRGIRVPTTVIHGNRDVLVRPAGGRATARAIPNARLKMIDGMGHDLPRQLWPVFAEEIANTAARAGKAEAAKQPA